MKALYVILISFLIIGCEEGANQAAALADGTTPVVEDATPAKPTQIQSGEYTTPTAHNTLFGDQWLFTSTTYKRSFWENSKYFVESGTYELIQVDGKNYIEFTPTAYNPSNCGYNFNSYRQEYKSESNGSATTQNVYFNSDKFTQNPPGWPYDIDYAENNLTGDCLK